MTTIAYKDGIIAADSQESDEGYLAKGDTRKLWEISGDLIGLSRGSYAGLLFIEWYRGNINEDTIALRLQDDDDFEALVIEGNGKIYTYNRYLAPDRKHLKHYAIGCGWKCAMVAMDLGCNAVDAVKLASRYDLFSGGKVKTIHRKLNKQKPTNESSGDPG